MTTKDKSPIDQTFGEIARANWNVPGVQEAYRFQGGYNSWTGRLKSYYNLLDYKPMPMKEQSASALWMFLVNLVTENNKDPEATNVFLGPVAKAFSFKLEKGDLDSLTSTEIAQFTDKMGKASRNKDITWLTDENRTVLADLALTAVQRWIVMYRVADAAEKLHKRVGAISPSGLRDEIVAHGKPLPWTGEGKKAQKRAAYKFAAAAVQSGRGLTLG